jgi:hypothetical protein
MIEPENAMKQAWWTQIEYFNQLNGDKTFIRKPTEKEMCAMIIGANIDYLSAAIWNIKELLGNNIVNFDSEEIAEKIGEIAEALQERRNE